MPQQNTAIFLSDFVNLAIKSRTLQSLFHFKYDLGRTLPPTFWPKCDTPPGKSLNVQKTVYNPQKRKTQKQYPPIPPPPLKRNFHPPPLFPHMHPTPKIISHRLPFFSGIFLWFQGQGFNVRNPPQAVIRREIRHCGQNQGLGLHP